MTEPTPLLVLTAAPDRQSGMALLRAAVSNHLAASGQVLGPAGTVYWHHGELGESEEWQVSLRTTADRYDELQAVLLEHHPWGNPEITSIALAGGSGSYLSWLSGETGPHPE